MADYHINVFHSEEDGGYIADIPDLKSCSAFGDTPEEALREVLIAKEAWLATAKKRHKPIPLPKRSRIYLVQEPLAARTDMPDGFVNLMPVLQRNGGLRNEDVRRILALNRIAATRYLRSLTTAGWLIKPDKRGLGALYAPGPRLLHQSQTGANSGETDAMGAETDAMKP